MRWRLPLLAIGLACWVLGLAGLAWQRRDLAVTASNLQGFPVLIYSPRNALPASTAVVLHGLSGSKEMMRPWAIALARRGLRVVLVDLPGHGSHRGPLPEMAIRRGGATSDSLVAAVRRLLDSMGGSIYLAGHSMGAGVALDVARSDPRVQRTVAVSGGLLRPGETAPPGYLAMVAERDLAHVLEVAGPDVRRIPGRNHLTILFDPRAHRLAAEHLSGAPAPPPRREWPFLAAGAAGVVLSLAGIALSLAPRGRGRARPARHWVRDGLLAVAAVGAGLGAAVLASPYGRMRLLGADFIYFSLVGMGVFLLLGRLIWRMPSTGNVRDALRGALAGVAVMLLLGPLIQQSVGHAWLDGHRIWRFTALLPGLWFAFAQLEGVGARPLRAAALLALGAGWFGASLLDLAPRLLTLATPVSLAALLLLQVTGFLLDAARHRPLAAAAFSALLAAWLLSASLPTY